MTFNPLDFLKISNELLNGNSEAHYRSIINRAYYAAFGHIRNALGLMFTDYGIHKEVIQKLQRNNNPDLIKAGKRLETLFKRRKECDYDHSLLVKKFQCDYNIKEAESIIKLFNEAQR